MLGRIKRGIAKEVGTALQHLTRPYGDSFWYEGPNLWEPTVQLALADLIKPGDTVFDVGANFGGLTSAMSRLVGPRGIVISFEASPRIFPHLQANIAKQGHFNVTAYPYAVVAKSNDRIRIYPGDHLNDSVYDLGHGKGNEYLWADTISLDDFCASQGIYPSLIKMDIEGAEYEALIGCRTVVERGRPFIILEQQPQDARSLELLSSAGYRAIDLARYTAIASAGDFPPGSKIRNVLFFHEAKESQLPYEVPVPRERIVQWSAKQFTKHGDNFKSRSLQLAQGRYFIEMFFAAAGTRNEMMCGIRADGRVVFRYHGYSKLLAESYRDWVLDIPRASEIELYVDFLNGTSDDTFVLNGGYVDKLQLRRETRRSF